MRRREQEVEIGDLGVTMPIFLGIWLFCALIAGLIWQNLVSNTLAQPPLTISFTAQIVLGVSFGLPGAGLICMLIGIVRQP